MNFLYNLKNESTTLLFIIFAFGILIYLPSVNIPFINDEIAFIQRNEVDTFAQLPSLFDKKDYDGEYYRPFPNFISGFTTLFFDYNFIYYRIFNFLIHSIGGILVFIFCFILLKDNHEKKIISLFASLFFLAFPLHDYAVIWHTDLFDRLLLIFYLSGLIFFCKDNFKPGVVSSLFFIFSLLSKEMAFSFPVIIFFISFIFHSNKFDFKNSLKNAVPYLVISAVFIVIRIILFDNNIFTAKDAHAGASVFIVIKNYILFGGLLGFPFFLREVEELIIEYRLLSFLAGIVLLTSILYYLIKKRRNDFALIFFMLFVLITIAPASRLLMRWYLYLPSVGFTAGLSYLIFTTKFRKKYLLISSLVLFTCYSTALISKEFKWIEYSQKADELLNTFVEDYGNEIDNNGIEFLTIPAKVDDIPIFQLGFNYHLNFYLKKTSERELIIDTKSSLSSFEDSIEFRKSGNSYFLHHVRDNYFILFDNQKNIKFDGTNKNGSRVRSLIIYPEDKNKILFTFSKGRFIKLSAPHKEGF